MKPLLFLFLAFGLLGCVSSAPPAEPRLLVIGDSMMAAHRVTGRAVSDSVAKALNEPVTDRSIVGARMIYHLPITGAVGFSIPQQYRGGRYDWVIVNGGGNDLWLTCGCHGCDRKLDRLLTKDGSGGAIAELVQRIRAEDTRVLWVGYMRSPGINSPIESCADEGAELEHRLITLSGIDSGMHYLSLADLVPEGDRSYHGIDIIHPSLKGSREIGKRIAAYIRELDHTR